MDELKQVMERLETHRHLLSNGNRTASPDININAGSIGIWACLSVCMATLVAVLMLSVVGSSIYLALKQDLQSANQKIEVLQAYINAGLAGSKKEEAP